MLQREGYIILVVSTTFAPGYCGYNLCAIIQTVNRETQHGDRWWDVKVQVVANMGLACN